MLSNPRCQIVRFCTWCQTVCGVKLSWCQIVLGPSNMDCCGNFVLCFLFVFVLDFCVCVYCLCLTQMIITLCLLFVIVFHLESCDVAGQLDLGVDEVDNGRGRHHRHIWGSNILFENCHNHHRHIWGLNSLKLENCDVCDMHDDDMFWLRR